jgi:hypothetical protein
LDDDEELQEVGPQCNEGSQGCRGQAAWIRDHAGHERYHLRLQAARCIEDLQLQAARWQAPSAYSCCPRGAPYSVPVLYLC